MAGEPATTPLMPLMAGVTVRAATRPSCNAACSVQSRKRSSPAPLTSTLRSSPPGSRLRMISAVRSWVMTEGNHCPSRSSWRRSIRACQVCQRGCRVSCRRVSGQRCSPRRRPRFWISSRCSSSPRVISNCSCTSSSGGTSPGRSRATTGACSCPLKLPRRRWWKRPQNWPPASTRATCSCLSCSSGIQRCQSLGGRSTKKRRSARRQSRPGSLPSSCRLTTCWSGRLRRASSRCRLPRLIRVRSPLVNSQSGCSQGLMRMLLSSRVMRR